MDEVRQVEVITNEDSKTVSTQKGFAKRWNIRFDNDLTAFKNRIVNSLRSYLPSNIALVNFEQDFMFRIGVDYEPPRDRSALEVGLQQYFFDQTILRKFIFNINLTQRNNLIRFFGGWKIFLTFQVRLLIKLDSQIE